MTLLQKIYISLLNPVYEKTVKINESARDRIVFVGMFVLYLSILIWYSINMFDIYFSHTSRMLFEILLLVIIIIFVSDKRIEPIRWNKAVSLCWLCCGLLIFIMGFIARQNIGYWMIGPVMAFGFPCLYLVLLNQEDLSKKLMNMCNAIILASLIYFVIAIFADFISDAVWDAAAFRYNGTTSDANRIGEICVASFACSMFIWMQRDTSVLWKILSALTMAFCICDAWISVSRSTLLAIGCMLAFYIIMTIKSLAIDKDIKAFFKSIVCIACCIILAFIGTLGMVKIYTVAEDYKLSHNQEQAIAYEQSSIEEKDTSTSENISSNVESRINETSGDLNTYSSGRITIWKTYISKTGFLGNYADGKTPIDPILHNVAAHNTILEFSYRSGILAGILFFIIELISGILILKVIFRKKSALVPEDIFLALVSIGYIIVSNLQVAYNPLTSILFFVYAIGITPLFSGKVKGR